jgi:hypothetical protein
MFRLPPNGFLPKFEASASIRIAKYRSRAPLTYVKGAAAARAMIEAKPRQQWITRHVP